MAYDFKEHPGVAVIIGVAGVFAIAALGFGAVEATQHLNTDDPSVIAAPTATATTTTSKPASSTSAAAPAPASTTTTPPTYMSGGWA